MAFSIPDAANPDQAQGGVANFAIQSRPPLSTERTASILPPGQSLTGKQEHYLKRELVSEQVRWEISELNSPTALRRFGAPFRSEFGEVSPLDSELPILRYIFVHHVREFPFLDKAKEKEFWQDKLQVFLESFASKNISSSEDRLEQTKRRKLALKAQKLIELMIVSGVRTSSGFEERIRFSELEIVDTSAINAGVLNSLPEGHFFNGWDVNIAGVRMTWAKRNIRYHKHAEFLLRVKRKGETDHFVARRYGDFSRLSKRLRIETPSNVLPAMPRKNKSDSTAPGVLRRSVGSNHSEDSLSSTSTQLTGVSANGSNDVAARLLSIRAHSRNPSAASSGNSPRASTDARLPNPTLLSPRSAMVDNTVLWRECQRISLRAFLRSLLSDSQVANTEAMNDFLCRNPIKLSGEDTDDVLRRKLADEKRMEEQKEFYEIARKRAADLDVYMEQFRQDIVERNGLARLFQEIKDKKTIQDLSLQYKKFAEWLRIEVAASIYHLFLAEDNSPELFAQAKRIHSLVPYTVIKNVIRIANPAAVMSNILDVFLAQPFGARSLMQRIFSATLNDGIRNVQKSIDAVTARIGDAVFVDKLKAYTNAEDKIKAAIREEAAAEEKDIIVTILRSDHVEPPLTPEQTGRLQTAYVAFSSALDLVDEERKQGAELFAYLKQLTKLCMRQRDKAMMLGLIEEPVTLKLLKDLFTIFYEPLVRVCKSASVYNSVTDFAFFVDDVVQVVERCRDQDASADPNQTVQAFIDLCQRHEHKFYTFVHEVHTHDNGLFAQLMGWIESILEFLRNGPTNGTLNINALFEEAARTGIIDKEVAAREINRLIAWQEARKKWHQDKTRQKMAVEGVGVVYPTVGEIAPSGHSTGDVGLDRIDLENVALDDDSMSEAEVDAQEQLDPIELDRRRRAKSRDRLRRTAGEPVKPNVAEVHMLKEHFLAMLRTVLAE